jgi:GNAT superfamily N-acetyltransferase
METLVLRSLEALPYLNDLANLRITVFAEYPYLYDGDFAYEKAYLEKFFQSKGSILGISIDDGKVVGGFTALPLKDEEHNLQKPFLENGEDVKKYMYVSEGLLLPEYRSLGIGVETMVAGLKLAQAEGFEYVCFCSVIRPENHPSRPTKYRSLDSFYKMVNFELMENYIGKISWKDFGETNESDKDLQFWRLKIRE